MTGTGTQTQTWTTGVTTIALLVLRTGELKMLVNVWAIKAIWVKFIITNSLYICKKCKQQGLLARIKVLCKNTVQLQSRKYVINLPLDVWELSLILLQSLLC